MCETHRMRCLKLLLIRIHGAKLFNSFDLIKLLHIKSECCFCLIQNLIYDDGGPPPAKLAGLDTIKITESPRRNILLMYRSLLIAVPRAALFFPPFDVSVHISLTSSNNLRRCIVRKQQIHDINKRIKYNTKQDSS